MVLDVVKHLFDKRSTTLSGQIENILCCSNREKNKLKKKQELVYCKNSFIHYSQELVVNLIYL
jgi:hypothetical protein